MMPFTQELRDRFMKAAPAQIGHYIKGGYMNLRIKPVYLSAKAVGPAWTIRLTTDDSSMLYYAMERAPKGSR